LRIEPICGRIAQCDQCLFLAHSAPSSPVTDSHEQTAKDYIEQSLFSPVYSLGTQ
jgi:hypothetical protein